MAQSKEQIKLQELTLNKWKCMKYQTIQSNYHKNAQWAKREHRHLKEIRKMMDEQNENTNKDIESTKKKMNSWAVVYNNEIEKKWLEGINNRLYQSEERIH